MGTQTWTYALILYFLGISVVWILMADTGVSSDMAVSGRGSDDLAFDSSGNVVLGNESISDDDAMDVSVWTVGKLFKHVLSLYAWNITIDADSTLAQYIFFIRLIFIWIPGLFLILSIIYSLPTMTG